jgi:hypothetical protein
MLGAHPTADYVGNDDFDGLGRVGKLASGNACLQ